ncbi:helix-turn-helix transcriptional regulator [Pseudoxanthobacter sp. M-2]|uniref:helix-turn-helix domain-containing protein n=1 Tax=Pseudoxanthobacter sp. M-2 TaxID=3078754 RepID=UPI0038FC760C
MRTFSPEHCRAARGLLGWTQEELATAAKVSRSTIRNFECGRHELRRESERLLLNALERSGVRVLRDDLGGPGVRLSRRPPA